MAWSTRSCIIQHGYTVQRKHFLASVSTFLCWATRVNRVAYVLDACHTCHTCWSGSAAEDDMCGLLGLHSDVPKIVCFYEVCTESSITFRISHFTTTWALIKVCDDMFHYIRHVSEGTKRMNLDQCNAHQSFVGSIQNRSVILAKI